jgi:hypothetical protein
MRFRSTAPPERRPTAYATRGGPAWDARQQVSTRGPRRKRRAVEKARKARGPRTLQIRRRAGSGPSFAGSSAALAPRGCSCDGGTHASCCGVGCWVGTCASRMASSGPGSARRSWRPAPGRGCADLAVYGRRHRNGNRTPGHRRCRGSVRGAGSRLLVAPEGRWYGPKSPPSDRPRSAYDFPGMFTFGPWRDRSNRRRSSEGFLHTCG